MVAGMVTFEHPVLLKAHFPIEVIWVGISVNDSAVQFYDEEVKTDEPIFNYDGKIRY